MTQFLHDHHIPGDLILFLVFFYALKLVYQSYLSALLTFRPAFMKHLFSAIIFGLCCDITLHVGRAYVPILSKIETAAADSVMNFWVLTQDISQKPNLIPFGWVTIDQSTFIEWGEPLTIPRDKIWQLISRAIAASAGLIVVDIQLDRSLHQDGDNLLAKCLKIYSEMAQSNNRPTAQSIDQCFPDQSSPKSFPPILFPISLRPPEVGTELEHIRPSDEDFLGNVIGKPPLLWASARVTTDTDYVLRKWKLFIRSSDGKIVPSIPLQTWSYFRNQKRSPDIISLATELNEPYLLHDSTSKKTIRLSLDPSGIEQRMIYPIGDVELGAGGRWCTPRGLLRNRANFPFVNVEGEERPLLTCISARDLTGGKGSLYAKDLRDRIVVIGMTYPESGDFHITPVGNIPGSLWLINAIEALMEYGQLKEESAVFFNVVLIVIVAMLFAWLMSLWATILSGLIIALSLGLISILQFNSGTWLDFTMPLLGIMGHRLWAIFTEDYQGFWRQYQKH